MKASVFIVSMLISISSWAQSDADSVVVFRKPVAQFLIGEHYVAERLREHVKELTFTNYELRNQIDLHLKTIGSLKADSTQASILLGLEKDTGESWKRSFEVEKIAHKETKTQLKKWKFGAVVGVVLLITALVVQ